MIKKNKAKVSYGMLIFIFLVFFGPVSFEVLNDGIQSEFYVLLGVLIPSFVFILYMFLKTEYYIEENLLKIKCGLLFNKSIEIHKIKKISKTNSPISSPARIEITYGEYDEIILSPKDKLTLAKDLTTIHPAIENNITED
ncbi:hypothetical protein pgond44_05170 [Psychroflexus gondwanensis ACAM 44]|uniref:Uncharacterized protein YyaB-like PH domain-containing protein n=1 Tax=Psychroflexus gondwanensis ACAM 44 TaxID=1189619 RepID=N1WXI5_9FLAO|nr:PH domain-containing protein [Psychroflexus gondwanensis]EMY81907.1 hypothetical protein pgond44_05170 [Psychroflexus gondwanensis ACAM 44]